MESKFDELAGWIVCDDERVKRLVWQSELYGLDENNEDPDVHRLLKSLGRRKSKLQERKNIQKAKRGKSVGVISQKEKCDKTIIRDGIRNISYKVIGCAYNHYAKIRGKEMIKRDQFRSIDGVKCFFEEEPDGIEFFQNFSVRRPTQEELQFYEQSLEKMKQSKMNKKKKLRT